MLLLLFGSSAAGKPTLLHALDGRIARAALHDFDEVGVPADADAASRRRVAEQWAQTALVEAQERTSLCSGSSRSASC